MSSVAASDAPRQFIAGLESKFSQLTVSLDDPSSQAEPLPVYTPVAAQMPKAQNPEQRGRSPGPRSLASRGLLRHRSARNGKPKSAHPAALAAQLKRRLHSQAQKQIGDDMEIDSGRGRNVRKTSVRAGVLVARKKRESLGLGLDEDADVSGAEMPGPSRTGATPYERNNSALIYWSRRRASSFGEQRPTWTVLAETNPPAASTSDESTSTSVSNALPTTRRRRSGRSASTSGLPLPLLDTTDLTVRRPSLALSLMMTPLIPDIDMASPMTATPVMRTSTESSMWAPRKLNVVVTHSPIEEDLKSAIDMKSALPASPPPAYDSVIRPDDSDGDADDERTPLRTAPTPSLAKREGSPVPGSGTGSASTSTPNASATTPLATVQEEEEPSPATPKAETKAKPEVEAEEEPVVDGDHDAMIL